MGAGEVTIVEMEAEVAPSMWPTHLPRKGQKHFMFGQPELDKELLEEAASSLNNAGMLDIERLVELVKSSQKGLGQLTSLAKQWEITQANAFRLLTEQLDALKQRRIESSLKHRQILKEHEQKDEARPIAILEDGIVSGEKRWHSGSMSFENKVSQWSDEENDSLEFWKSRARRLDQLLSESLHREEMLMKKLQETSGAATEMQPLEQLQKQLLRADNFLHFILKDAPIVIAHQDKELRYRFFFNQHPELTDEDIIGKRDDDIFHGVGLKELLDFKEDVMRKGVPMKRELSFETDIFGNKSFLIAAEPVFNKNGETIGLNYVGFDITDQVTKMEKLAQLREEIAVQKAMETELHKTIYITEETMRAKQMLATMSHEIRSPLSGVVSMAEILSTTKLDSEQRQLVEVMMSSGDLVLQLINDILDLSKVESGAMKLESKRFRPREVVKHVLQTAAVSLQNKQLILEGAVADNIPDEVVGDVLRIRQVLTNLVSNGIKFTHEGTVGILLRAIWSSTKDEWRKPTGNNFFSENVSNGQTDISTPLSLLKQDAADEDVALFESDCNQSKYQRPVNFEEPYDDKTLSISLNDNWRDSENSAANVLDRPEEWGEEDDMVMLQCDVFDTGIGIPDKALPTLFKKYMQASTDHARKYGGTGLGLAICKKLVERMGGALTVTSKENIGTTFSFSLPCKTVRKRQIEGELKDEWSQKLLNEQDSNMRDHLRSTKNEGYFRFDGGTLSCSRSPNQFSCRSLPAIDSTLTLEGGVGSLYSQFGNAGSCSAELGKALSMRNFYKGNGMSILNNGPSSQRAFTMDQGVDLKESGLCMNTLAEDFELKHHQKNQSLDQELSNISQPLLASKDMLAFSRDTLSASRDHNSSTHKACEDKQLSRFPLQPSRTWKKPKILLAEDNNVNIMVAQSMMKRLGHSIDVVNNGAEVLQALQRSMYDLILMDVCMPVMDGFEATRRIRKYEETGKWEVDDTENRRKLCATSLCGSIPPEIHNVEEASRFHVQHRIPIIALTANALTDNIAECYAQGMDSFVAKPVTFHNLKQVLNQFIPWWNQDHANNMKQADNL